MLSTTLRTSYQHTQQALTPFIDIYDAQDRVIVKADMPGVSKEHVEIEVNGDRLTICGRHRTGSISQSSTIGGARLIRECPHCDYFRVLKLSDAIDAQSIAAEMKDGVLTLTLPKKQAAQPVEVPISIEG